MFNTEAVKAQSLLPKLNWVVLNDSVMGGESFSKLVIDQQSIQFSGQLSLINSGGFASVRGQLIQSIGALQQLSIRVKGDNRVYQFRVRTSDSSDDIAYKVEFLAIQNKWQQFNFTEHDFVASFRGRAVSHAPSLKFSDIKQLGFLIADKNIQPFRLIVEDIWVDSTVP